MQTNTAAFGARLLTCFASNTAKMHHMFLSVNRQYTPSYYSMQHEASPDQLTIWPNHGKSAFHINTKVEVPEQSRTPGVPKVHIHEP